LAALVCAWPPAALAAQDASSVAAAASTGTCGNGVLEQGESCDLCPADCTVRPCHTGSGSYRVAVDLSTPPGERVAAATVLVTYRAGTVRLPGKGSAPSVRERVHIVPNDTFAAVNDRGYALRVALARPAALTSGRLLDVDFDACGDSSATIEAFRCIVEGCGGESGAVAGCRCSVSPSQDSRSATR
jgi:hypothetical protein